LTKTEDKEFSKDVAPLHQAVGSALAMWSQVERGLVLAFRSIAKIESYAVAEAIMSSTQSFRGRMRMIDTIIVVEPLPDEALAVLESPERRDLKNVTMSETDWLIFPLFIIRSISQPTDTHWPRCSVPQFRLHAGSRSC
jgi:hypothetical protein